MRIPGIRKVKGKGGWRIRVKRTLPTGEVVDKVKTLPPGTPLSEAVAKREELLAEIEAGGKRWATVRDYGEWWMGQREGRGLTARTLARERGALSSLLYPFLGGDAPEDVDRPRALALVRWIERRKSARGKVYAQSTLALHWKTLAGLLRDLSADLGTPDPTHRVKPPRSSRRLPPKGQALTRDQLVSFLDHTQGARPVWHPLISMLALTGCRISEAQGLCWDKVDLEAGELHLVRRWTGVGLESGTKTNPGRLVPIHPRLARVLRDHQRWLLAMGLPAMGLSLCFPGYAKGRPLARASLQRILTAECKVLDLPRVTPHDFRHTFNTLMVRAGVDRLLIREMIGHLDEGMTEHYHHASPDDLRGAVRTLDL